VTRILLSPWAAFQSAYPAQLAEYLSDRYMFQIQVVQKIKNIYAKQTTSLELRQQVRRKCYAMRMTVLRLSLVIGTTQTRRFRS
jgi:hypothetical protein